jgi:hypothetical protein
MRGKWERGIQPRNFHWVIKDKLAVCERPGGYSRNHRKVRRHEEILWIRNQGFTRVVSLLQSSHNLHAYSELGVAWSHFPLTAHSDVRKLLMEMYSQLHQLLGAGEKIVIHGDELSDTLMGLAAGYLLATRMLDTQTQAITLVERMLQRQMGPPGRELVAVAANLGNGGGRHA